MLSVQNLLPRLPVPKLAESLMLYLRAVRPLLSNDEFTNTERAVRDFVNSGIGPKLQAALEQRAANVTTHPNWLSDWWLNGAYLEYRDPLVLFSNPSFYLPPQKFSGPDDQFRLASGVISAALDYRATIVKHELKPETVGKDRRLCMAQYTTLFDGCRIPLLPRDKLVGPDRSKPQKELPKSVEVVVTYRNKFYNLRVETAASDPQSIFDSIITLKKHESDAPATPVGIMTAWDRDNWAVAHEKLEKAHSINAANLDTIRRCAFVICLDTQPLKPVGPSYSLFTRSLDNVLHGGGSAFNTGNRWFDKTVQFIISHDGMWGVCQEHAPCEALPTVALADFVGTRMVKNPKSWRSLNPRRDNGSNVKSLDFNLSPELEQSVSAASRATDKIVNDIETHVQASDSWGRDGAKKIGLSADGLLQMGLQVAYYRLHGAPGSCYETGSTRRFLLGRTDTIRPCSIESLELCKEMASKNVDKGRARELLLKAVVAHQEFSNAVLNGRAFDRHFMGLKRTAQELGIPLPVMFTEKGYQKAMHHMISTSQVSSVFDDAGMGYGPLQPDGYGCCYNIRANRIQLAISAWRSCSATDPHRFGAAAAESLAQLYEIAGGKGSVAASA